MILFWRETNGEEIGEKLKERIQIRFRLKREGKHPGGIFHELLLLIELTLLPYI
jgi:hypothetical protein